MLARKTGYPVGLSSTLKGWRWLTQKEALRKAENKNNETRYIPAVESFLKRSDSGSALKPKPTKECWMNFAEVDSRLDPKRIQRDVNVPGGLIDRLGYAYSQESLTRGRICGEKRRC